MYQFNNIKYLYISDFRGPPLSCMDQFKFLTRATQQFILSTHFFVPSEDSKTFNEYFYGNGSCGCILKYRYQKRVIFFASTRHFYDNDKVASQYSYLP